jgi:hypothetical protein
VDPSPNLLEMFSAVQERKLDVLLPYTTKLNELFVRTKYVPRAC